MMLKLRSFASQLCGIFPYNCLHFALGSIIGFQTILIAELDKKDSEIHMTREELSWYASLSIFKLVGSIDTGLLTHRWGSRVVALATAALYIASWLQLHYATTATMILVSRTLNLLLTVRPLANTYISEISEPHLRGSFLAIAHLSNAFGLFFTMLLGSLVYWRSIALVNLVFPILAAAMLLVTPNSPVWLASKGRLDEAERALCWLRGWVQPIEVQTEFRALVDSVQQSKSTSDERKLDAEAVDCQERSRRFFRPFLQRSFYSPLATICIIFFVYSFSGMEAVQTYATVIFREMKSPMEATVATAIMGAMAVVGQLVILLSIRHVGKRKLVFFSVVVVGLCQASIALVGFLKLQHEYLTWISPIALIVAVFADASGTGTIVYMLVSEIFPSPVRYLGTSISMAVNAIMMSLMGKFFLYVVDAITLPGVFIFFALVNLVALITFYFVFPETEGRSLREIEDHFKGVYNKEKTRKIIPKCTST